MKGLYPSPKGKNTLQSIKILKHGAAMSEVTVQTKIKLLLEQFDQGLLGLIWAYIGSLGISIKIFIAISAPDKGKRDFFGWLVVLGLMAL